MARRISVTIVGDADKLDRSFRQASRSAHGFGRSVSISLRSLLKVGAAVAVIDKLSQAVHLGIHEFAENTQVAAQTAAAIKSTGHVAGISAKEIDHLGLKLSNLSGIDDEVVRAGENVLLSFTKIRNQAGKGNDIFTQATKAAADWASRTGRDLPQASLLLGKALEDPARKAASLARAGIVFSQAQLKQIKAWEAGGNVLKAQKFILAEVEKRFRGAAEAAGKTLPGQLNVLRDRFKDLVGSGIALVAPAVAKAVTGLTDFVRRISEAKGLHAKLQIVWEGIKEAASKLWTLLGDAIRGLTANLDAKLSVAWTGITEAGTKAEAALRKAIAKVDWKRVWANAKGISEGLQKRLRTINWQGIGKSIGVGLVKAVKFAVKGGKALAEQVSHIVASIDWVKLGKAMGPGLAAALVVAFTTLLDPSFWIKNWDLALSVALVVFGKGLGKFAGKLAKPFARLGGKMVLALAGEVERLSPKVASALLAGLIKLPGLAGKALAPLGQVVKKSFGRLGKLARFTIKVLGVQAVIDSMVSLAKKIGGVFTSLSRKIEKVFTRILNWIIRQVNKVIGAFNKLPGPNISKIGEVGKTVSAPAGALGPVEAAPSRGAPARRGNREPHAPAAHAPAGHRTRRRTKPLDRGLGLGEGDTSGTSKAAKHFALPLKLKLEQAKAAASGVQSALLAAARHIRQFLLKTIPKLKGQKLLDAYGLLAQANSTIASAAKEAATRAKDAALKAKQKMAQARQALADAIDNVRSQLGELFQGPILAPTAEQQKATLGVPGTMGKDLTRDLRAQTALFRRFEHDLAILKRRGASKELIKELRAKGTAALPQIETLAKSSRGAFAAFLKAFRAREKFVRHVAKVELNAAHVSINAAHLTVNGGGHAGRRHHRIPALAQGGIVRKPTIALIGEAGPERVEPLGRSNGSPVPQILKVFMDGHEVTDRVKTRMQRGVKQSVAQRRGRYAGQITAIS
jgi:hypothetical protein